MRLIFYLGADPGFLREAANPKRGCQPIIWSIFPENCIKKNLKMDRGLASKILLCRSANAIHLFLALGSKLTNLTLLYHLTLTGCQLSKRTR